MCELDVIWAEFDAFEASDKPKQQIKQTLNHHLCSVCNSMKLFSPEGLPTCSGCGLVDSQYVDDSPEWISGVTEDGKVNDMARCGMPQDLDLFSEQWGTGSIINTRGASYKQKRLAMINFHGSMNHKDRALFHAYKDFDLACVQILGLTESIVRDAKIMYRKFGEEKLTRGAVRTGIKANCVLYACKMNKVSRTTKEIADAFKIPSKDISRTSQIFKETIVDNQPKKQKDTPICTTPHDILHRLLNEFEIPDKRAWRIKCLRMADKLTSCVPLMGKTPTSVASVIILKVLNDYVTKQSVCEKCGISVPTLNKIETIVNKHLEDKSN